MQGAKPAIITASRPITKMIVTQPKSMSSASQATATKIIPTKIVYGQQGKTQVSLRRRPLALLLRAQLLLTSQMTPFKEQKGAPDCQTHRRCLRILRDFECAF